MNVRARALVPIRDRHIRRRSYHLDCCLLDTAVSSVSRHFSDHDPNGYLRAAHFARSPAAGASFDPGFSDSFSACCRLLAAQRVIAGAAGGPSQQTFLEARSMVCDAAAGVTSEEAD